MWIRIRIHIPAYNAFGDVSLVKHGKAESSCKNHLQNYEIYENDNLFSLQYCTDTDRHLNLNFFFHLQIIKDLSRTKAKKLNKR